LKAAVAVSPNTKRQLLSEARMGCCIHRRIWLRLMDVDRNSRKYQPLDIHHVKFRSLGGSDSIKNLVPLCPTCHRMVHDARRAGRHLITDGDLRHAWQLWKRFRLLVPETIFVGSDNFDTRVRVDLSVYSLASTVTVDSQLSYAGFREALIDKTVRTFRRTDPDFPFRGNNEFDSQWTLSCDHRANGDWRIVSARQVLLRQRRAITLTATQIFELAESVDWRGSTRPAHRRL
jgi:hypothetical protein